jgi:threonylcarbamoyladenosine tRNA methylthiotransferase MtaB
MAFELEQAGYRESESDETADVVVINTCTVTDKSDARCRAAIRKAKKEHPGAQIVVAGCYVETNPDEVMAVEGVSLAVGNVDKFKLVDALAHLDANAGALPTAITSTPAPARMPVRAVKRLTGRTNAYLNIQGGCDELCAFCVVKIARGKNRFADPSAVIGQIGRIADSGVAEVILSGVNLGDFGKGTSATLATLVQDALAQTAIQRIRFSSINPNTITDQLIDLIASSDRICRHLHIPLQSGSDSILHAMRRPYTAREYSVLLEKLNAKIPGIGIGADIMVGFPGETDSDFLSSYDLIAASPIMMLHVFNFSPRENTEAFTLPHRVDKDVAKERSALLNRLSIDKNRTFRERFVGTTATVLVETARDKDQRLKGFTDNYLPVTFDGPDSLRGTIAPVHIDRVGKERLEGSGLV